MYRNTSVKLQQDKIQKTAVIRHIFRFPTLLVGDLDTSHQSIQFENPQRICDKVTLKPLTPSVIPDKPFQSDNPRSRISRTSEIVLYFILKFNLITLKINRNYLCPIIFCFKRIFFVFTVFPTPKNRLPKTQTKNVLRTFAQSL